MANNYSDFMPYLSNKIIPLVKESLVREWLIETTTWFEATKCMPTLINFISRYRFPIYGFRAGNVWDGEFWTNFSLKLIVGRETFVGKSNNVLKVLKCIKRSFEGHIFFIIVQIKKCAFMSCCLYTYKMIIIVYDPLYFCKGASMV